MTYRFTVFTPTYNRGYIIEKAYRSLQQQTFKDFEWIVIDDGSTDNTQALFNEWTKEDNFFPIRYFKVENGGKHRAINKGVALAQGELFIILDSDDTLTADALEKGDRWEKALPKEGKVKYAGVSARRGYTPDKMIGTTFKGDYVDASTFERKKHNITGDTIGFWYTNILKQFPFPEFPGENFMQEGVMMNRIAHVGYIMRWYNDIIYICNYLPDGLSHNSIKLLMNNPMAILTSCKETIAFNKKLSFFEKMAQYHRYILVGRVKGYTRRRIAKDLEISVYMVVFVQLLRALKRLGYRLMGKKMEDPLKILGK